GINGCRWMLGHADIEHIWHYITQEIDGASLRGAKSQYVIEELMHGKIGNYKNLVELLKAKYGTDDFTLIDIEEADFYIQEQLEKGNIIIEPEFLHDHNGTKLHIIVKILHIDPCENHHESTKK